MASKAKKAAATEATSQPDAAQSTVEAESTEDLTASGAVHEATARVAPPPAPGEPPAPNGVPNTDGLPTANGLPTSNGLPTANGLATSNGLPSVGTPPSGEALVGTDPAGQNPFVHYPFQPSSIPNPPGWYPDVEDAAGLRFWDGMRWTEHRARLAAPALAPAPTAPAVCECGVVAVGTCRVCTRPYCRAHISETPTEDRAFLLRWEAWTCVHCLEDDQRAARARQLARCENVAAQIATIPKMARVRTITGLRPRLVNLFQRSDIAGMRPARHARAYLIEYDGGEPDSTYLGLAISATGETVFDVGAKVRGVPTARLGPKRSIQGYLIRKEITVEALREASARSTRDSWFEFASRAYLRAGRRLGIKPMDAES